jgi:hypothetical protein
MKNRGNGLRPCRLVITVCPRERGVVAIPRERGEGAQPLDAEGVLAGLEAGIATRRLGDRVTVRRACAGGCLLAGPNVSVVTYPLAPPGEKPDHVAVAWKSYVGSLETLRCLADVLDDDISAAGARRGRTRAAPSPPR